MSEQHQPRGWLLVTKRHWPQLKQAKEAGSEKPIPTNAKHLERSVVTCWDL